MSRGARSLNVLVPDDALVDELGPLPAIALDTVSPQGPLPASCEDVSVVVASFDLRDRIPEIVRAAPKLELIQSLHAGVEPLLAAAPPGVTVCSASGVHDIPVSEWVVAAILVSYKQLLGYRELQRTGTWDPTIDAVAQGRIPSVGPLDDLEDKVVLVVGHGSIGRAVERRLAPFGVRTVGVASRARTDAHGPEDLDALVPEADVVVVLAPGSPQNTHLLDARRLASLKDGALLVNAARGTLVDQDALVRECGSGRIRAVLDVTDPEPLPPEHPLWTTPNVFITPHAAGSTPRWRARAYGFVGEQLRRFAEGRLLENIRSPI